MEGCKVSAILVFATAVGTAADDNLQSLNSRAILSNIVEGAKNAVGSAIALGGNAVEKVSDVTGNAVSDLSDFAENTVTDAVAKTGKALKKVLPVTSGVHNMVNLAEQLVTQIIHLVGEHGFNTGQNIWKVGQIANMLSEDVREHGDLFVQDPKGYIKNMGSSVTGKVKQVLTTVKKVVNSIVDSATSKAVKRKQSRIERNKINVDICDGIESIMKGKQANITFRTIEGNVDEVSRLKTNGEKVLDAYMDTFYKLGLVYIELGKVEIVKKMKDFLNALHDKSLPATSIDCILESKKLMSQLPKSAFEKLGICVKKKLNETEIVFSSTLETLNECYNHAQRLKNIFVYENLNAAGAVKNACIAVTFVPLGIQAVYELSNFVLMLIKTAHDLPLCATKSIANIPKKGKKIMAKLDNCGFIKKLFKQIK